MFTKYKTIGTVLLPTVWGFAIQECTSCCSVLHPDSVFDCFSPAWVRKCPGAFQEYMVEPFSHTIICSSVVRGKVSFGSISS